MIWLKRHQFLVCALLTGLFLMALVSYYLVFSDTWFDETDHAYKAWLTAEDLAFPFQDFALKYGPIGFYSQVLWQWLFGPSVLAPRVLSILFLFGLLALVFDLLRRRSGRWLGLIGVAFLVFHPYLIGKYVAGTPYSLIAFFLVLSLWFWSLDRQSLRWRIILSSAAMALAALVRYNLLPVLVLWWLFIWLKTGRFKNFLLSLFASIVVSGLGWSPYALIDWEYAASVILVMFGPLATALPLPFFQLSGGVGASNGTFFVSLFSESRFKLLFNVLTTYYPFFVLFLAGIISLFCRYWGKIRILWREQAELIFLIVSVVVIFLTHFFLGPLQHKIYSLYFAPFLVLAISFLLPFLYRENLRSIYATVLISVFALTPISVAISGNDIICFNRWNYQDSDLVRIRRGGEYLASLTSPDDLVLTIDNPDQVFLAGRLMVPERINRHDTYSSSTNRELLKRFARYNTEMFLHWLKTDADLFVAQKDARRARLEPIAGERGTTTMVAEVEAILAERYELVGQIAGVYPRKETRGSGVMEIYRRLLIKK